MLPSTPLLITPVILSEAYRDTTPELLGLVHETLSFIAQKSPDKIALVSRHQSRNLYPKICQRRNTNEGTDCLRWSYQLLQTSALRRAEALQLHGIQKGMRVATFLNNGVEYLLAQWACSTLVVHLFPSALAIYPTAERLFICSKQQKSMLSLQLILKLQIG
jgi:acyl-CoA synthetase (AMP-forming)/AMP-acid ligase II